MQENVFYQLPCPVREDEGYFPHPVAAPGLTVPQLDGFFRQIRGDLGTMLNQLSALSPREDSEDTQQTAGLNKTFHQMLHLTRDLEFLHLSPEQARAGFHPVTMDLAGLCADLERQSAPLLRKAGVKLEVRSTHAGLLIPGDPVLLRRMLLELISSAARAGDVVTLSLRLLGGRAVLTVKGISTGAKGAELGLDVARRIVTLHGGTLLTRMGPQGGLVLTAALPTAPLSAAPAPDLPGWEEDGGLSPFLVGLADLLPEGLFEQSLD